MTEYLEFEGPPPADGLYYEAVTELGCCFGETYFDVVWFDKDLDFWRTKDGVHIIEEPVEWGYLDV